ncbi:uncharacterized protein [Watersipora subatra]|uniref:uncharacterized protein n=1 Tax=Watersipora subatra TaxID=2589382 RepID=UPI00355AEC13
MELVKCLLSQQLRGAPGVHQKQDRSALQVLGEDVYNRVGSRSPSSQSLGALLATQPGVACSGLEHVAMFVMSFLGYSFQFFLNLHSNSGELQPKFLSPPPQPVSQGRDIQVDGRGQLGARGLMPGEQAFEFIVEVFGFCKRLDSQGRVIQGTAILLSTDQGRNTMSEREFLQVRVTDEGQVALATQNDSRSPSFGISFSRVELRIDDKRESRERYSRLLLPDTANEETIDERYFEVLRQRDGTYRLATVINPNLFVALIRVRNGYELAVLPYNSNFSRDLVSYDFNIDIPEVRVKPCYQPHAPNHVWPPYHNHHNHYNHHNHPRRFHDRSSYRRMY